MLRPAWLACLLFGLTAAAGQARIVDATVLDKVYPAEQVAAGLDVTLKALGACFRPADGGQAARGEVAFQIGPNGKPAQITVSGDLDPGCTERESSRWRFDRPSAEVPQVFVTLEWAAEAREGPAPDRERAEFESFCSLIQQLQPRTQDPKDLTRKALRTLLGAGMTTRGQRWAGDMLRAPPEAQLAEFEAAAGERGLKLECPEYVGWHQRTFASRGPAPLELTLVAGEGPSFHVLLRNRSVSEQWVLRDDAHQPDELVLLDASGQRVRPFDERSRQKFDDSVARTSYQPLPPNGAVRLRDEAVSEEGGQYALHWGPFSFGPLAPGAYRAKVVLTSAKDEWTDPASHAHGVQKGVWKGTLESNEVRFTLR